MVALAGFGILSLVLIPKESAPEVQVPVGVVTTLLLGAPAADVESLVTNELERGLVGTLENVNKITSTSREGVSSIVVEFDASADIDKSINSLKDKVDALQTDLPRDAEKSVVSEVNFVDQPIMSIAVAGELNDLQLSILADDLEKQLEALGGISRVETDGVKKREVTIVFDQTELEKFNLSFSQIISSIQAANTTLPVGQIVTDGVIYNVAFDGDIEDSSEIADIALTTRGSVPVFVRDIATISDGLSDSNTVSRLSVDGKPSQNSITFSVYKQRGGDITSIARSVNNRLDELQTDGELLSGLSVSVAYDAGADIAKDLIRLSTSGLTTVVLVVLVLILAIGWREGLVAGSAIPLSFVIGFIGLYLSDNTVNFVSLFALILAIGILVDSAIVMVEGVNRRMKEDINVDKQKAALETIKEFSTPLIAGTLTTVSMFSGLFLVSGVTGQFIAVIPFTINFILLASLLVALGFVPLLASTFLRRRSATNFEKQQTIKAHQLENWYGKKLKWFLRDRKNEFRFFSFLLALLVFSVFLAINLMAGVLAAILIYFFTLKILHLNSKLILQIIFSAVPVLLMLGLLASPVWSKSLPTSIFCFVAAFVIYLLWQKLIKKLSVFTLKLLGTFNILVVASVVSVMLAQSFLPTISLVKVIFFEQSDIDFIYAQVELPQGTIKETTDIAARRMEEVLYKNADIDSFITTVGRASQFGGGGGTDEKYASFFISLRDDRTKTSTQVVEDLRNSFAPMRDLFITVDQPSDGPPTGADLGYRFLGDDLLELSTIADQAAEVLKRLPNTTSVITSTNTNSTEFVLTLDREKAAALGLNPLTVSQTLRSAVYGTDATSLTSINDDIDVVVRLNLTGKELTDPQQSNFADIDALKNISLTTPTGDTVLLSSLVDTSLRESSSVISHDDNQRVISISASLTADGSVAETNAAFLKALEDENIVPKDVKVEVGGETEESNQAFIEMFVALIVGIVLMLAVLVLQFNSFQHTIYVLIILPFSLIGIFIGLTISQLTLSFPSIMGFIALSGIVVNNSILLIDQMNSNRKKFPQKTIEENVVDAAVSRLRPILLTTITTVVGMIPLTYASDLWSPLAYAIMFGLSFSVIITLILVPIVYMRRPGTVNQ